MDTDGRWPEFIHPPKQFLLIDFSSGPGNKPSLLVFCCFIFHKVAEQRLILLDRLLIDPARNTQMFLFVISGAHPLEKTAESDFKYLSLALSFHLFFVYTSVDTTMRGCR